MFKSAGLVARYDKKKALELAEDLAKHLRSRGLRVYAENTLKGKIDADAEFTPLERMNTDFIISIGGDGTILRTCVSMLKPAPPILGINMGVRGFLAEVEPKQSLSAVDRCIDGEFKIEKCMRLATTADSIDFPDALNEIVILADEPAKLLYTKIMKDGESILNCQADGLMISTQTGSTGYSLSAGGPVLDTDVDAFVLTPICPLTAFRPVVFPAKSRLTIQVDSPKQVLVLIDGRYRRLVPSKTPKVTITRAQYGISFIRFKHNFYDRLRNRLLFKAKA